MQKESQDLFIYDGPTIEALDPVISRDRLSNYMAVADQDKERAYQLYTINTRLSEALYPALQMCEIALRNRFHTALTETFGEYWYYEQGVITNFFQREKIKDSIQDLLKEKQTVAHSDLVATLSFGFWVTMLNKYYEDRLWRRCLAKIFYPKYKRRSKANTVLHKTRFLRNRVAHHEPIIHHNLRKRYKDIIDLTEWLSSHAAMWSTAHSRFLDVLDDHSEYCQHARDVIRRRKRRLSQKS